MDDIPQLGDSTAEQSNKSDKQSDKVRQAAKSAGKLGSQPSRAAGKHLHASEEELIERYRNSSYGAVLPDLEDLVAGNPAFDDYHTCWLTTTNPRDSIHMRLRLGYELIHLDEIPEMAGFSNQKSAGFEDYITVNEMIAAKLHKSLYEQYMHESHVQRPFEEQEKLTSAIDAMNESALRSGGSVTEGDGFSELRKSPGRVRFT